MVNKILITGGNGYIGSCLSKYLVSNDYECSLLVRKGSDISLLVNVLEDVDIIELPVNLTAEKLSQILIEINPEVVVHLASLYITEHAVSDVESLISSNVLFGAQLLDAMKETGVKKLINIGTSWQYFEGDEYDPTNLYSATKQAFIVLAKYYVSAHSFQIVDLKLFDTYGATDKRQKLIKFLVDSLGMNKTIMLSPGEQKINLSYVDDVIDCIEKTIIFLDENHLSDIEEFSVFGEEDSSIREIVRKIEVLSGQIIPIKWGGRPYRKREVMTPWKKRRSLPGWRQKTSLDNGLIKMLESFKKEF